MTFARPTALPHRSASAVPAVRRVSLVALAVLLAAMSGAGCQERGDAAGTDGPLFERLDSVATGITFANTLAEGPDFNILNYPYYYNGGGVATGDVNGDGRLDLFFTSNEGPDRLYVNRGAMRFEDVTNAAGVAGSGNWTTGAVMADVNGDRRLDLYVMNVGGYLDRTGRNELFINDGAGPDGVPRFTERAGEFGLDFEGYATHAAFFDYDRDGDLDAYLLNHATHTEGTYRPATATRVRSARASDRLMRNDGGRFTDVSEAAGIVGESSGYGLSIAVADFDDDGWVDLYVGNDFHESDYLYRNNRDGTFTEMGAKATPHTSTFSMGSDAADVDGDGRVDLVVLDMLPAREAILKTSAGADTYAIYMLKRRLGYNHQLSRNTLQLNRGGTDSTLRFSDVAQMAGVSATDWSWAALLADLDLDGHRDLFITNGIYRRPNDLDYINYVSGEVVQQSLAQGAPDANRELLDQMPRVPLAKYAYRNRGDVTFEDVSKSWGIDDEGFSNGAAYADLDDDGDLDLVVNNVNAPASVYRNHAERLPNRHRLQVTLEGDAGNTGGIGARVRVRAGGRVQVAEQSPSRGFLSSVDPRVHLGLGASAVVDTLTVRWPDGRVQTRTAVPAGRITLRQADATAPASTAGGTLASAASPTAPLFEDVTTSTALPYRHVENGFLDFNRERLMPHRRSTEGPAAASADVNGDGLDDLFLGGARDQPGRLLIQDRAGRFAPGSEATFAADSLAEDVDAAFFDADGDGDADLYVVSGGNEFWGEHEALRDRLYRNDGRGNFTRDEAALPRIFGNGRAVAPADIDGDGDLDLFVGRQTVPREYGRTPPSVLLENDGRGRFRDVTATRAPALTTAGMIADAVWADIDGDGDPDLVVAGEWMPMRVFVNTNGRLADGTEAAGLAATSGWWNALLADDLDGDGDVDLVGGNLGLNSRIAARTNEPVRYYLNDFDGNGAIEGVLTAYREGAEYPDATLGLLRSQFESIRRKYPSYAAFGARPIGGLFSARERRGEIVLEATTFASVWAENVGGGRFTVRALPALAQIAPVYALLARDLDGDGRKDLMLAGNFFGVRPDRGREDASYGLVLRQAAPGRFEAVPMPASGVRIPGEVRALVSARGPDGGLVVAVRNDDAAVVLRSRAALPTTPPAARPSARTVAARR